MIEYKNDEISSLKQEIVKIRSELSRQLTEIEIENKNLSSSLELALNQVDTLNHDSKSFASLKDELSKENKILKKEIELIEKVHSKAVTKQKDMKKRLVQMDSIMYGHSQKKRKAK